MERRFYWTDMKRDITKLFLGIWFVRGLRQSSRDLIGCSSLWISQSGNGIAFPWTLLMVYLVPVEVTPVFR